MLFLLKKSEKPILASSSEDETIMLWEVSKKEADPLKQDRIYEDMNLKEATGLTEVLKEDLEALGAITSLSRSISGDVLAVKDQLHAQ